MEESDQFLSWTPQHWESNKVDCAKLLKNNSLWEKIPLINCTPLHCLVDKQLVRFRGMIQDMFNPEFYLSSYEVLNKVTGEKRIESGKYKDIAPIKPNEEITFESPNNVNSERQTFYCVCIPGLNQWAVDGHNASSSRNANFPSTAVKLDSDVTPSTSSFSPGNGSCNSNVNSVDKRTEREVEHAESCRAEKLAKKDVSEVKAKDTTSCAPEYPLNFPIPGIDDKSCLLKVYDDVDAFLLNEMVEVVGFLSVDPAIAVFKPNNDEGGNGSEAMDVDYHEEMALNPPPSLVPRVHVVAAKKLSHANPLLPSKCHHTWSSVSTSLLQEAKSIREELMLVLTQLLLGDQLAAEYLLCHLVSTIYLRNDTICLGQLSVNLSNIPTGNNYAKQLYDMLTLLIPHSHYLPMTISNMNKLTFRPKKDYKTNRLTSGVLQLSSNTHLVLDETALTPGQLDSNGVHNITALGNLITQQNVDYDFQFYNMEFQANIPVLILSEGKSLLPSDVQVKLKPDSTFMNDLDALFAAARHYLKDSMLDRIRKYLTVAKLADYSLSDEMQKVVQSDFVEMRKSNDASKISGDDLHRRLIVGRLLSLSMGQQTLTKDVWKRACELEDRRKASLSASA
ncbi:mini-chromosome maintenance complex-binding protein [Ischnura elegans]|uniref:mini-chromosome maintenance complex-binding protein n=1 Tax=Ischnura elegans TaxID=197161 RepID=UPI001ED8BAFB|nr:mini-chromosome maintenance complex-binding protein [Ischnura elegans]